MSSPDYHSESRSGINPFHSADGHRFLQRNKARCILRYELNGLASEGTINEHLPQNRRHHGIIICAINSVELHNKNYFGHTEECSHFHFILPGGAKILDMKRRRTWDSNPEISSSLLSSKPPETGALTITPVRPQITYCSCIMTFDR